MLSYNISKFFDHPYREDLLVKLTFIFSILFNITTWLALYWKIYPFSYLIDYGQISLHYNVYFGIDKIGFWYQVFFIPLLGLFIIIFNNILAYIFYLQDKLISYLILLSQFFLQVVLLLAAIFVILLNI